MSHSLHDHLFQTVSQIIIPRPLVLITERGCVCWEVDDSLGRRETGMMSSTSRTVLRRTVAALLTATILTPFFSLHTWDKGSGPLDTGPLVSLSSSILQVTKVNLETPSDVCFSPNCIKKVAALLARAYPYKTNHSSWIRHAVPSTENIINKHNTTRYLWIKFQECCQLFLVTYRYKKRTLDSFHSIHVLLKLTPSIGVAPAVKSSEVT